MTRTDRRQRGRIIQMVFQDPYTSLDPRQRVGDTLDEILKFHFSHSPARRRKRITELLESVGLAQGQMTVLPRELSGGQRQRVAIIRALAAEPKVLVLDEHVAALDVSIQAQIINLLADIRERTGVAYLVISHDLAVIRHSTDEALVMQHGQLVESGPTTQVLDRPRHPYTQRLRAAVPRPGWRPRLSLREAAHNEVRVKA
jgi:ABC-type glutathione transport system ATPase component